MKYAISLILMTLMMTSCGHMKKEKSAKEKYSPKISFEQNDKTYAATVELPKDFKEKLPLVVIVHEWWGRTPYIQKRGEMLNSEGYATLVVDLFGNNIIADTPAQAQAMATPFYKDPQKGVELLKKYIEEAKKDPHVDPNQVYVIGYCFGGTQALNLARSGADIKGVVSFHGGLTSTMKAKDVKAKVLAINGLADPMVPAKDRAAFEKEMKAANVDYKMINYKGATHAFTNPEATEKGKKFNIPIAYNKQADQNSWNDLLRFLKK